MDWSRDGDKITLQMNDGEWTTFLLMLGRGLGMAHRHSPEMFKQWVSFTNELNRTNPNFAPYEIPE